MKSMWFSYADWFTYSVMTLIMWGLLIMKLLAFVDCLRYRKEAYEAAGRLTKPAWMIILGLGLMAQLLAPAPVGLIGMIFTIAALVYLLDVRPAVREVLGKSRR